MTRDIWDLEPLKFKVGSRMKVRLLNGSMKPTAIHISGIINDSGEDVVVYRWWVSHKKYWRFEAETARALSANIRFWRKATADRRKEERQKKRK